MIPDLTCFANMYNKKTPATMDDKKVTEEKMEKLMPGYKKRTQEQMDLDLSEAKRLLQECQSIKEDFDVYQWRSNSFATAEGKAAYKTLWDDLLQREKELQEKVDMEQKESAMKPVYDLMEESIKFLTSSAKKMKFSFKEAAKKSD